MLCTMQYSWPLRDKLDIKSSSEWLAASVSAVLMDSYTGIKIPTNHADRFRPILGGKPTQPDIERANRITARAECGA